MQLVYIPKDDTVIINDRAITSDTFYVSLDFSGDVRAIHWNDTEGEYETFRLGLYKNIKFTNFEMVEYLYTEWEKLRVIEDTPTPPVPQPEPTLEELKVSKQVQVNELVNSSIVAGFWYQDESFMSMPLHFSYDLIDQSNFETAMNAVNKRSNDIATTGTSILPDMVGWNGYADINHINVVAVVFNSETYSNFWMYSAFVHKQGYLDKGRLLKEQITAATTIAEVNAIEIKF